MSAMAGNLPDFEEATRTLFAENRERFEQLIHGWPKDIRSHLGKLTKDLLGAECAAPTADST